MGVLVGLLFADIILGGCDSSLRVGSSLIESLTNLCIGEGGFPLCLGGGGASIMLGKYFGSSSFLLTRNKLRF